MDILPTVKCSTCNNSISLDVLGDHDCSVPSAMPAHSRRAELERSLNAPPSTHAQAQASASAPRIQTLSNARRSPSPLIDYVRVPLRSTSKLPPQPPPPTGRIPFPPQPQPAFFPRQPSLSSNRSNNSSPRPLLVRSTTPSTSQPSAVGITQYPNMVPSLPYYPEGNINTTSGGEAGMAGVGRRGFAAAARAAMFSANYIRRADPPRFLDIDATKRAPTETPPLSAGSSHSPGTSSPFPQTPSTPDSNLTLQPHSPSPSAMAVPSSPARKGFLDVPTTPTTPTKSAPPNAPLPRLPFFEKFKNKMPGAHVLADQNVIYETTTAAVPDTPSTAVPFQPSKSQSTDRSLSPPPPSEADSISNYAPSPPTRNISLGSTKPRNSRRPSGARTKPSSDTGRGLAYADSDTDTSNQSSCSSKSAALPLSILRSESCAGTSHVRFPSKETVSTARTATSRPVTPVFPGSKTPDLHRQNSTSSLSSTSNAGDRPRTNSYLIAQALGLSGTPPKDYEILGGPGVTGFRERLGRSASKRSNSSASRSHSRHPSEERASKAAINAVPTASTSKAPADVGLPPPSPSTKRSNTVQATHSSPEARTPKLPTRSKTSPMIDRGKQVDGGAKDHDRERQKSSTQKVRICVRCSKTIDDGRWVQCEAGSVLCDLCWKSMYLPKCRRCDKPIERQAVSSSDGQLKGKYHRECFNCHVCHKPFPDKTFYVFDSKPLCAYHYHEANKSLCSATMCGQPIEGPCAVSHSGERYHPHHFTCEHPTYPPCSERLVEYWEVDGRMLCENHATASGRDVIKDDWDAPRSAKAKKRVTRFIDLANGVEGSDLL